MLTPSSVLIDACVEQLEQAYCQTYGRLEPDYPGILTWAARMALEQIANTDALYHNVEHTVLVTLAGQDILIGKHYHEGGVSPHDWLHCILSCLYHDIGYLRGVCKADQNGTYTTGIEDEMVSLPLGATDAALTAYHVDRGKCFVRERFAGHTIIDIEILAENIERTRFPIPSDAEHQGTADYPGLVRAADFIGQLADPGRMRKFPALFYEFEEIGMNAKLGYASPGDLRQGYPTFFWHTVRQYLTDGLRHLGITQQGRQWIANLYAYVCTEEHHESWGMQGAYQGAGEVLLGVSDHQH